MRTLNRGGRNFRQITALAVATTFLTQNFAWAVCSDGTSFPAGNQGFVNTTLQTVAPSLANMSPNVFTASAGSVFIPDNSAFENNDPTNVGTVALNGSGLTGLPVAAVGGHNWVFDQGSTTCKETSTSSGTPPIAIIPGQAPAGWAIPPNTTTDCFVLPVVKFQTITVKTDLIKGQVTTSTSVGSSCNGIPGTTTVNNIVTSITCSVVFSNFGVVPLTSQAIADVFTRHLGGNCLWGPNSGFSASPVIQPNTLATYTASNGNQYMFTAGTGQPVIQTRMTQDAIGQTHYSTRTFFSNGNGFVTGVGIAPDMNFTTPGSVTTTGAPTPAAGATGSGSVIIMQDPSGLGLAAQGVMSRLPLCEDF